MSMVIYATMHSLYDGLVHLLHADTSIRVRVSLCASNITKFKPGYLSAELSRFPMAQNKSEILRHPTTSALLTSHVQSL